jgi:pyruvate kinase
MRRHRNAKIIATLVDLQGPKLRVGTFTAGRIILKTGARLPAAIIPANLAARAQSVEGSFNQDKRGYRVRL